MRPFEVMLRSFPLLYFYSFLSRLTQNLFGDVQSRTGMMLSHNLDNMWITILYFRLLFAERGVSFFFESRLVFGLVIASIDFIVDRLQ